MDLKVGENGGSTPLTVDWLSVKVDFEIVFSDLTKNFKSTVRSRAWIFLTVTSRD